MLLHPEIDAFAAAERRLFDHYDVGFERRAVRLADPALATTVRECGAGEPVLFVHGAACRPLRGRRCSPTSRTAARARSTSRDSAPATRIPTPGVHCASTRWAQLSSTLDALGLDRAALVGTSLGAMWTLCLALDRPERVRSVVTLGMPAVALPGLCADPFFRILTTPGLGRLAAHAPAPKSIAATRKAMASVLGERALDRTPDAFFELVRTGMAKPGWGIAMGTHLALAMRAGRVRTDNILTDDELRAITAPVQMIWGDRDVYGSPQIARRARQLLPDAQLEVIEGGHAPFLDDAERWAQLIRGRT